MQKKSFISPNDSTLVIILKDIFGILFIIPFLFWPAGTYDWPEGWLFTFLMLCYAIGASLYFKKNNPEFITNRTKMELPDKTWDKILLGLIGVFFTATFVVAPLDAVRYSLSAVPLWLKSLGFIGFTLSLISLFWIFKENSTLFITVKIKKNQKVVSKGPYAIIRHPMYAFSSFMAISVSFALGSYYSLIPSFLFILVLIVRTNLEDKTLQKDLPGYKEYSKKVRYKLIPKIF